jgi:glycosyltransferase involved in cell wall biosynthesis
MGGTNQEAIDSLPRVPIYVAGFISDESDKLRVFSASDVLLFTSRADNQPLTILEALVSGIQIVGFEVGGLTELQIRYQGITLSQPGDEASVVRHLLKNSHVKSTENINSSSKNLASKTLSEHVFLKNHLEFYSKVIQNEK